MNKSVLTKYMSKADKTRYLNLLRLVEKDIDGKIAFELAQILQAAARRDLEVNHANEPICQYCLYFKVDEFLPWIELAKGKGHVEATYEWCIYNESLENWDELIATHTMLVNNHQYALSAERLGFLYEGHNVYNGPNFSSKKDLDQAVVWYKKAAELGIDEREHINYLIEENQREKAFIEEAKDRIKNPEKYYKSIKDLKELDPLLKDIIKRCIKEDYISVSSIQRRYCVGFARASKIIDDLEDLGYIGLKYENERKILITKEIYEKEFGEIFE